MANIDPNRSQFEVFKALPRDQPILMLNLIKLKEKAVYEDGTTTTGALAYEQYGKASAPVFQRVGGSIAWRGEPQCLLIGPESESWDIAFIARYPTAGAFLEMVTDETYRKAVKHRQAAVADSRLLRMGETGSGESF